MHVNDAKLAVVAKPQIDDGEYAYLSAVAEVSATQINDMWVQLTDSRSFLGGYNDGLFAYLGSLGYTGTLNDRLYAFWVAGGTIPPL